MRILLVRLRLIGDVVFTTPAVHAVRRRFPDATIVYLVEPVAAAVVSSNPHINEVIVIPHTRGLTRVRDDFRMARRLRAMRFDVAVDFHGGPRSAWFTWATRAPVRVGYDVAGRTWMYTHVVHRPRVLLGRHSVANQWELLHAWDPTFGLHPNPDEDRVEMASTAGARATVDARLAASHVPVTARVIVLHVSAGNPFRRWPESSFAELAADLTNASPDRWILLTGGPSDRSAVSRVLETSRRLVGAAANRIVDAEGLSLEELRALFDRASLFVGGDSGPLHVAATSDVAVVGLYGPTLPRRSAPWRPSAIPTASVDAGDLPCRPCDQRVCAPGDFRCLTSVPASSVRDAAERLLEHAR